MTVPTNVTYVFIDASNLWQAQKAKGKFLDYQKIANFIKYQFKATAIKIFYYTAYPAEGTRDYSLDGKHKFFTFLKKGLGFEVRKKALKRITVLNEHGESVEEKGNMDVEMTIDAMYHQTKYQTAVLFTGDSDFLALVTHLRSAKKIVYVISSKNNVSQELRTSGDGYFDILEIADDIWGRELKHRQDKNK